MLEMSYVESTRVTERMEKCLQCALVVVGYTDIIIYTPFSIIPVYD